jgi:Pyruvate/2-oxoacid:ferredoxin oxidoreductase delta subunit
LLAARTKLGDGRVVPAYSQLVTYFFSGTGNARRLSLWITETAQRLGAAARVQPIEDLAAAPPPPAPGSLVGFVFPVHGFTTIWLMLKFVWRFPRAPRDGQRPAVFTAVSLGGARIGPVTLPGWEGSGLYLPLLLLWLKGYRIVGAAPFRYTPQNWTALVPSCSELGNRHLLDKTGPRVPTFVETLLEGRRSLRGLVSLFFGIAVVPISLAYLMFGRFFLAKLMFASSHCDGCGICVTSCPTRSILLKRGRPFWKFTCESCMRCMNYCPRKAIQASQPLAVALSILFLSPLFRLGDWLTQRILHLPQPLADLVSFLGMSAVALLLMAGLYRAWLFALRFRPVMLAFEYSTPTRFFKRYREPQTHLADLRPLDVGRRPPGP